METINGNFNGNNNKSFPTKSRSNFSQAAVNKSDVGDFHAGYFVMAEHMPQHPPQKLQQQQQHRQKNHKTPERNIERRSKSEIITNHITRPQQPQRARSAHDLDNRSRESESNVSNVRLTTSPTRSPNRNKRNSHSPQSQQSLHPQSINVPVSPHKPRKAHEHHVESGSPTKDKGPSPPPNRWAGPAFSNAPPPSSLPIPDFPPFLPQSQSSSPPSAPAPIQSYAAPTMYHDPQLYIQPPLFAPPYSAHYYGYAEFPAAHPSLTQLSTDLRRMLNISEQPIPA